MRDLNQSKAPAASVIAANREKSQTSNVLTFPSDLGVVYTSLSIYDYRTVFSGTPVGNRMTTPLRSIYNADRQSVNAAMQKQALGTILLPIPESVHESHHISYEQSSFSGVTGAVADAGAGVGRLGGDTLNAALSLSEQMMQGDLQQAALVPLTGLVQGANAAQEIGSNLLDATAVSALLAARTAAGALAAVPGPTRDFGRDATMLLDLLPGVTLNPNLVAMFRGPTLRSHQFRWSLSAQSQQESETIEKIIRLLRRAAYPEQINRDTAVFLKYPAECFVEFLSTTQKRNVLFNMRPTVITAINVDYTPHGKPSFYWDLTPTMVNITISLMETSYTTREDFSDPQSTMNDSGITLQSAPVSAPARATR